MREQSTDERRKRQGSGRMVMSKVMTIIIFFQMFQHRDFKNFYTDYLALFYKSAFPNLLSYPRFVEMMPTYCIGASLQLLCQPEKGLWAGFMDLNRI